MTDTNTGRYTARDVFGRLDECRQRGHDEFCQKARTNEDYFLGGGLQWDEETRREIEGSGRPVHEANLIISAVLSAIGYQIANRMDVAFLPTGGATDSQKAKLFSKVFKSTLDRTEYRYAETDLFSNGLIQQRGFFDVRMDYEHNVDGDVKIVTEDSMDVVPDPDAKEYDPDTWADVLTPKWLTEAQIEGNYGADVARAVKENSSRDYGADDDFGAEDGVDRARFGNRIRGYGLNYTYFMDDFGTKRYRVVGRQSNFYTPTLVAKFPTGDIEILPEGIDRERVGFLIQNGVQVIKRRMRRVRWQLCAPELTLFDKVSPYEHFTIVPYFPIFRGGRTRGMVDNAISPQDLINKFLSQIAHVVNSSANGGWQGEEDQLVNMSMEELEDRGAETGLVLIRKQGTPPLVKIEPNNLPNGMEKLVELGQQFLRQTTGVDERLDAGNQRDLSGIAIQSLQFAAQQKLAVPLDNLGRTRRLMAKRVMKLLQTYMGDARLVRITEMNPFGIEQRTEVAVNTIQPDGSVMNDLTTGQYDIAITDQPIQVTFDNSQYRQAIEMRKEGVKIPDAAVVRYSSLADKEELAAEMQTPPKDPLADAEAQLKAAQARLADATATAKSVEAQFSAMRAGEVIVLQPGVAAIADALLLSAGYKDQNAPPIVPQASAADLAAAPNVAMPPANTNPLTPDNPQRGMTTGIEAGPDPGAPA